MKKTIAITVITGLVIAMCLVLLNCSQTNQPEDEKDETGIVVPGISMDGVKIGDTEETVIAKLGIPDAYGFADGLYRAWLSYDYIEGPHAGLEIYFIADSSGYGPVDKILAGTSYSSGIPYSGKTQEGIGLGSTLKDVHNAYGLPDTSISYSDRNRINEMFCNEQKHLEIAYRDSVVTSLIIGFYKPMPEDPYYDCK
jgi:hypothetical protein